MSNSTDTTNTTADTATDVIDRSILAGRVIAAGGGGFPQHVTNIYYKHGERENALHADRKLSSDYRAELSQQNFTETDEALRAAEENDVAQARQSLEHQRGQLLGEMKSADGPPPNAIETASEQQTRLATRTLEQLRLNNQLLALSSSGDPEFLVDSLEAAFLRESPDRARAMASVIVGRLRALAGDEGISGANTAYVAAAARYRTWSADHPSAMARLRRMDEQLVTVEQPIRAQHAQMRSYFKWGRAAFGQRI